ncbi:MAG TPA: hypothetical protein PKC98_02565 [Candidatus Melainabacteria bacterium]|nr:hypothetical protein [Candidatus Melainabacteria bacterium]
MNKHAHHYRHIRDNVDTRGGPCYKVRLLRLGSDYPKAPPGSLLTGASLL